MTYPKATLGFIHTPFLPSTRTFLRRPVGPPVHASYANVGSGMVEAYGPAEPRYSLAERLAISETEVPISPTIFHTPLY